jgi:hypothetical protein
MTGTNVDSKPMAAMMVERTGSFIAACFSLQTVEGWLFELVTDCLVFIGFLVFAFCFGFSGRFVFPVHVRKRNGRVRPATTAQFFRLPLVVLGKSLDRDTICRGDNPS